MAFKFSTDESFQDMSAGQSPQAHTTVRAFEIEREETRVGWGSRGDGRVDATALHALSAISQ